MISQCELCLVYCILVRLCNFTLCKSCSNTYKQSSEGKYICSRKQQGVELTTGR